MVSPSVPKVLSSSYLYMCVWVCVYIYVCILETCGTQLLMHFVILRRCEGSSDALQCADWLFGAKVNEARFGRNARWWLPCQVTLDWFEASYCGLYKTNSIVLSEGLKCCFVMRAESRKAEKKTSSWLRKASEGEWWSFLDQRDSWLLISVPWM